MNIRDTQNLYWGHLIITSEEINISPAVRLGADEEFRQIHRPDSDSSRASEIPFSCQPDPRAAKPSRVAVDETAVEVGGEQRCIYAAIDVDSKLLLDIELFSRRGTDPTVAFLHRLKQHHDLSGAELLVDAMEYLTALSCVGLSGQLDYTTRNYIEKWFRTLTMQIDRFHSTWVGGRTSARRRTRRITHFYNQYRPNQALDRNAPAEVVQN